MFYLVCFVRYVFVVGVYLRGLGQLVKETRARIKMRRVGVGQCVTTGVPASTTIAPSSLVHNPPRSRVLAQASVSRHALKSSAAQCSPFSSSKTFRPWYEGWGERMV